LKLVLGGPEVPVGSYARAMFMRLGVLGPAEANVVSNEEDVKAVVSKVRLGEADAGVVYRTDVTSEVEGDLKVIEVPRAASPLAVYPMAALEGAPNPEGARDFVNLVDSQAGSRVLRGYGFGLP
ncbi:MAG: molybdate ABC transporter substrate-binding protein, partial [Actinomycetota bacterium]|nr:molybdate ABC transporter substrate-binding protein [Actinomycetota bacterium]